MSPKESGSDVNFAYPNTEIAVMGASGAINILLHSADENEKQKILNEYNDLFPNPFRATEKEYIDEIIRPKETCNKLSQALDMTHNKSKTNFPKKQGNMPL